jgi:hypothetical protein
MGAVFETELPDRKRGGLAVSHDQDAIFILGDPPALDRAFGALAAHPAVVAAARRALGTGVIVLHSMTVTAKAPYVGSGIGWHRDADNRYMRSRDGHFVRIMVCLDAMGPANGGTRFQIGSHRLARPKDGFKSAAPPAHRRTNIAMPRAWLGIHRGPCYIKAGSMEDLMLDEKREFPPLTK